jgi:endonuclease-3
MTEKVNDIIEALELRYPDALCALHYEKDYELMIAVRLSAQCTDARVNMITPALFEAYPTLDAFAAAEIADVENYVHSCGFYRQKAKDIVMACQMLINDYNRKVPDNMDDLLKLPGVGRKSANLILGDVYGKPAIVADTHCIRLSNRIGFMKKNDKTSTDPVKVEMQLKKVIAPEKQNDFCHRLVEHGRAVCTARKPYCEKCVLAGVCDYKLALDKEAQKQAKKAESK